VSWWLAVARLTTVLAGVGLTTSRLGLVGHELVGHGGVVLACGGRVLDVGLFWFAGGWIRYDLAIRTRDVMLAVALGGIALELAVGLALWFAARRPTLGMQLVRAVGAALVVHACWYLATGTWHGYGDGALLRRELGDARWVVAIPAGAAAIGFAYAGARAILGVLAATVPGRRAARIGGLVLAVLVAGGLQLGLALGEVAIRGDRTYGAIMQTARERVIAQELARWERAQGLQGRELDRVARQARARALADQHRELPFAPVLGVLVLAAIAAGAARARAGEAAPVPRRLVAIVTASAVVSVALVIALDIAFV